ncbi:MAG: hypothetical protein V8T86_17125 [Victivallis sp.]
MDYEHGRGPCGDGRVDSGGEVLARAFVKDGKARVVVTSLGEKARALITVPGHAGLKSRFGKIRNLGNGRYEFSADAIDSDILE